jgi:hypothetical protein
MSQLFNYFTDIYLIKYCTQFEIIQLRIDYI